MQMELSVDFAFAAAHRLPYYDGPCNRVHGHNYTLRVTLTGTPNPKSGMIEDFEVIRKKVWDLALVHCDHHDLNGLMDNPTAEHVAAWMWERLRGGLPTLTELKLWENPQYCVTVRP